MKNEYFRCINIFIHKGNKKFLDDLNQVSLDQKPSFKKVVDLLVKQYAIMTKTNPNAGEKVTEMLIEHGAKVNAEDNDEMTPLNYALVLGKFPQTFFSNKEHFG